MIRRATPNDEILLYTSADGPHPENSHAGLCTNACCALIVAPKDQAGYSGGLAFR